MLGIAHHRVLTLFNFTITAEILARSLAKCCQQAGRHMNLLSMRCIKEREQTILQFVIERKTKLTSDFHASVLLWTMNFVITMSKPNCLRIEKTRVELMQLSYIFSLFGIFSKLLFLFAVMTSVRGIFPLL